MQRDIGNLIKFPFYILGFINLGLIFGYLTFKVLSFSRTVEVPDLHGKTLLEANKLVTHIQEVLDLALPSQATS